MWTFEQKSFPKLDFVIKYNLIIGLVSFRIKPKSLQKKQSITKPGFGNLLCLNGHKLHLSGKVMNFENLFDKKCF